MTERWAILEGRPRVVLRFVEREAAKMTKAVACPPGLVLTCNGRPWTHPCPSVGMILMHADGRRTVIAGRAVLRVLWNGVLGRAGVPVEYEKGW